MNIQLLGENFTVENSEQGVNQLIDTINKTIAEKGVFFSHMIVDEEEIYDEPVEYLVANIKDINQIVIKVKTIEEFVNDLFVSLNRYANRAIPEIEKLVDQFYKNPTSDSWTILEQLLEGIEWVYQTIKNIDDTHKDHYKWDEYIKVAATFEAELPNLLDGMKNRDSVLIADIIQYEILPQFKLIYDTTEEAFDSK